MRHILATLVALLACLAAEAESHYKPHISVGAHAGTSMGRVTFSPAVEQQWEQGICGGVSVRYAEEKLVGLVAEVNFSQGGWKEYFEDSPLKYSRKLTYLTLPIMTHVYFGPRRFKCFFNLGPQFGYMISESTSANFDINDPYKAEGWPDDPRMTEQLAMPVKTKFDYGITAGFGCEFWLKPRHSAYVEARFYYGLGNIFPSSKADTFSASRCMTLAVTIGYNFRLK